MANARVAIVTDHPELAFDAGCIFRVILESEDMATVLDRLRDQLGEADESVYARALRVLAAALPVDRKVELTEEVVRAAVAGDVALVMTLLAPKVEPEASELEALAEADAKDHGSRVDFATVRSELSLDGKS